MRFFAAIALMAATALTPALAARPIGFAEQAPAGGALVIPLASEAELASRGASLDAATREAIARALRSAEFDYAARSSLTLRGVGPWSQLVVVGTGGQP